MDKTLLDWAAPRSRKILTIIYGDCKDLILRKDSLISEIYNSRRPKILFYKAKKESGRPKLFQIGQHMQQKAAYKLDGIYS